MLRDVYLCGAPGRQFGRHFRLDIVTPHEAIRALHCIRPGTRQVLRNGTHWRFVVGTPHIANSVVDLNMRMGSQPLYIVPATPPHGGDGGFGKVAVGIVTIGAAIALSPFTGGMSFAAAMATQASVFGMGLGFSYGAIALMGAGMVLGGVSSMLSPTPAVQSATQPTDFARPEDRPSFMFNGPVNNTQQGGPVPLVFGTHLTGSVVISASLNSEDIPA